MPSTLTNSPSYISELTRLLLSISIFGSTLVSSRPEKTRGGVSFLVASAATLASVQDQSWLERRFKVRSRGSTVGREVVGGLASAAVAGYIVFVNPAILSFAGVPGLEGKGPAFAATLSVTCLTAAVLSFLMGWFANYPFLLAPGMGINSTVAFGLVAGAGLLWQEAMGVIFLSGVVVLLLVLSGMREAVMKAIPEHLKESIAVGIGLFIALIGFVNGGLVKMSGVPAAPLTIGAVSTPTFVVFLVGLVLMAVLVALNVRGGLLIGIIVSTLFAMIVNALTGYTAYSSMPGVAVVPNAIVSPPDFSTLGQGLNFGVFAKVGAMGAVAMIFSVMILDFFDTMGTVTGVGKEAGFLNENGEYPPGDLKRILVIDSLGPILGGAASASSNTTYIESAAGVSEGARTGLASVVTAIVFLLAMFFAPLAGVVPPQATAPALVMVGFLMFITNMPAIIRKLGMLNRQEQVVEGFPALLTMVSMPFTYGITTGIGAGFITYTVLRVLTGKGVHGLMALSAVAFFIYFIGR